MSSAAKQGLTGRSHHRALGLRAVGGWPFHYIAGRPPKQGDTNNVYDASAPISETEFSALPEWWTSPPDKSPQRCPSLRWSSDFDAHFRTVRRNFGAKNYSELLHRSEHQIRWTPAGETRRRNWVRFPSWQALPCLRIFKSVRQPSMPRDPCDRRPVGSKSANRYL